MRTIRRVSVSLHDLEKSHNHAELRTLASFQDGILNACVEDDMLHVDFLTKVNRIYAAPEGMPPELHLPHTLSIIISLVDTGSLLPDDLCLGPYLGSGKYLFYKWVMR